MIGQGIRRISDRFTAVLRAFAHLGFGSSGQVLSTTGSALAWIAPFAVSAASDAQQEAGTATNVYTSPGTQHRHRSAAKAWINFNGSGTIAIREAYNVSSITDNGTGNYTVSWDIDFSNANYAVVAVAGTYGGAIARNPAVFAQAAGTVQITPTIAATGAAVDTEFVSVTAFGDQ